MLFVVGKGGVGKTTVSAALALAAIRRGKRVLVAEMDEEDHLRPVLGLEGAPSRTPTEVVPGLFRMSIDGKSALEEYLGIIIPVRRVLRAVFESRIYQYFVAAAPGLKELMAVGKLWYEVDQRRFDLIIVDSPATGHGLQYLRMPKVAFETFTAGLVHREAKRVWNLLSDPERTAICVVTTAEEMPVNESLELCQQIRGELRLPEGVLFVNRMRDRLFEPAELEAIPGGRVEAGSELVREALERAREETGWREINELHRARLASEADWPIAELPYFFREEFGWPEVEALSHRVEPVAAGELP